MTIDDFLHVLFCVSFFGAGALFGFGFSENKRLKEQQRKADQEAEKVKQKKCKHPSSSYSDAHPDRKWVCNECGFRHE